MSEINTTYLLNDPNTEVPMDRGQFYAEQIKILEELGQPTRAIEVIHCLLFNPDKEIILQKRSHDKNHNPFLIDKAIGGHIRHGDSPIYTLMVETVQELRVPSIVLRNEADFCKTYKLLSSYLDSVAVVKEFTTDFFNLQRVINKKTYNIAHKVHLFLGVYGGSTRPVDKEASGVLYYDLDVLKEEMKAFPQNFTHDLHFYLEKYKQEIEEFLKILDKS